MKSFIYILIFNLIYAPGELKITFNPEETPVLKLNFYLMGKNDIDQSTILEIGKNIEYLNQEFEGKVVFELNRLFMDHKHEYLPNIYSDYIRHNDATVDYLTSGIEEEGAINIFLLETFADETNTKSLMGFTPILRGMHRTYKLNSPNFDRVFMAYPALLDKSTLVHEMGHFLGLSHPWEMNSLDMHLLGLDNTDELNRNHMTYNNPVDKFTPEQLLRMRDFAQRFRWYLLKS